MKKSFTKFSIFVLLLSAYAGFAGCNNNGAGGQKNGWFGRRLTNDTTQVKDNITAFLTWYKANYKQATSFPFLQKDKSGNPVVNDAACKAYLDYLSSSKLLSAKYREYWQQFFNDKKIELATNPIGTDVPEGFDMDLVLITQEPERVLERIDSIQYHIVSMNDSVALVGLKWPAHKDMQYEFEMAKGKAGWLINYISTPNYD